MNSPGRGNKLGAIASFSLFLFGNLADAYTTIHVLGNGGIEANPFMAASVAMLGLPEGVVLPKLLGSFLLLSILIVYHRLLPKAKQLRTLHLILAGAGILYLFFAFSNYYGWLTFSL